MSAPTTRLSTALDADCCWKRVISFAPIEKPCQLMIVPGVLVTFSVRASGVAKDAEPLTTCGRAGLAEAQIAKREHDAACNRAQRKDAKAALDEYLRINCVYADLHDLPQGIEAGVPEWLATNLR